MKTRAIAIAAGILAILTVPRAFNSDGMERWRDLEQLLRQGTLSGSHYSLVGPLFATPLAWMDGMAASPGVVVYYNALIFLLGLFALWKFLVPSFGRERMLGFTAILVFASMFPAHTVNFYGEVFTAVAFAVGSAALVTGRPRLGAALLALGAANTPATLVPLALMLAWHARRERRWVWLALLAVPVIEILLENHLRHGGFFVTGYEGNRGARNILPYSGMPGFSYPFLLGVFSILLSFGKGLIFYTPGLFTPAAFGRKVMPEPIRQLLDLWLAAVVGFILIYAKWWDWSGDEFWGPRLFLFCSFPASLALAWWLDRVRGQGRVALALLVLALSFWVGFDGLIFGKHRMDVCYASDASWISLCWYTPEFSALARPFVSPRALGPKEALIALIWLGGFLSLALPLMRSSFRSAGREPAR